VPQAKRVENGRFVIIPSIPQQRLTVIPGGLSAKLRRIDEMFKKRCRIPTGWGGDWPTIKQLDEFSFCNDEWAQARRGAINAVRAEYLVTY
jgi:hypothetical protein